ncbi:MAG TPA: hypothetical protein VIL32_11535, partial [Steroidobacteraceae bacterium]
MTTPSQYGVTLGQLREWMREAYAPAVDGISAFMDVLQDQSKSLAQKLEHTADWMDDVARQMAQKADDAARAAVALDPQFPHAAEVFNRMHAYAEQLRGDFQSMSKAQYVEAAFNEALQHPAAKALGFAGDALDFAKYVDALQNEDYDAALKQVISWTVTTELGLLMGAGLMALGITALPAAILAGLGMWLVSDVLDAALDKLPHDIYDQFRGALNWIMRRDPLTLDLDGDGIESVGIDPANPVLFDHDGDGVSSATGWVSPDDGFLVLDRNGNGTIDSGRELFGDSTLLPNGQTAADGFAALAAEDTNGDGAITSADARFGELRVWRDFNQDGVSQAGELFTLDELGITAINVSSVARDQVLANGNVIADVGTYVRSDGTEATVGETHGTADVDLIEDTFYRDFDTHVPLEPGVENLPNMGGSGRVRDLWEAASLSSDLRDELTAFAAATTRAGQLALVDGVLASWAATSDLQDLYTQFSSHGYILQFEQIGADRAVDHRIATEFGYVYDQYWTDLVAQTVERINILQAFNGRHFFAMPGETGGARSGVVFTSGGSGGGGG